VLDYRRNQFFEVWNVDTMELTDGPADVAREQPQQFLRGQTEKPDTAIAVQNDNGKVSCTGYPAEAVGQIAAPCGTARVFRALAFRRQRRNALRHKERMGCP